MNTWTQAAADEANRRVKERGDQPAQHSEEFRLRIGRVNRHLKEWANYFKLGVPRKAFRPFNHFVRYRLGRHLRRRSDISPSLPLVRLHRTVFRP